MKKSIEELVAKLVASSPVILGSENKNGVLKVTYRTGSGTVIRKQLDFSNLLQQLRDVSDFVDTHVEELVTVSLDDNALEESQILVWDNMVGQEVGVANLTTTTNGVSEKQIDQNLAAFKTSIFPEDTNELSSIGDNSYDDDDDDGDDIYGDTLLGNRPLFDDDDDGETATTGEVARSRLDSYLINYSGGATSISQTQTNNIHVLGEEDLIIRPAPSARSYSSTAYSVTDKNIDNGRRWRYCSRYAHF